HDAGSLQIEVRRAVDVEAEVLLLHRGDRLDQVGDVGLALAGEGEVDLPDADAALLARTLVLALELQPVLVLGQRLSRLVVDSLACRGVAAGGDPTWDAVGEEERQLLVAPDFPGLAV